VQDSCVLARDRDLLGEHRSFVTGLEATKSVHLLVGKDWLAADFPSRDRKVSGGNSVRLRFLLHVEQVKQAFSTVCLAF